MIEKDTEEFFEQLLKDEKDIQDTYVEALGEWDKDLFKIQVPFIVGHKEKKNSRNINTQKTR